MAIVVTNAAKLSLLSNEKGRVVSGNFTGALYGAKIGLYGNGPVPSPSMALGDFAMSNGTAFANQTVTWLSPYITQAGAVALDGQICQFVSDGNTPTQTVSGYVLFSPGPPVVLLWAEQFENAVPITGPNQSIEIVPSSQL